MGGGAGPSGHDRKEITVLEGVAQYGLWRGSHYDLEVDSRRGGWTAGRDRDLGQTDPVCR